MVGGDPARRVCGFLRSGGHQVRHLIRPSDEDLRQALNREVAGVAILLARMVDAGRPGRKSGSGFYSY